MTFFLSADPAEAFFFIAAVIFMAAALPAAFIATLLGAAFPIAARKNQGLEV